MPDQASCSHARTAAEAVRLQEMRVLSLPHLLQLLLKWLHLEDRVYLRDLIDVGVVGAFCLAELPPALTMRLQEVLDDPLG